MIEGREIKVETLNRFPVQQTISHNYVRKTFFTLAFCECCQRLLFHGFRCLTCGIRFHQRCADNVPPLCQPLRLDNYYQHLLALNSDPTGHFRHHSQVSSAAKAGTSPITTRQFQIQAKRAAKQGIKLYGMDKSMNMQGQSPNQSKDKNRLQAPTCHRERSTSAPNVNFNQVGAIPLDQTDMLNIFENINYNPLQAQFGELSVGHEAMQDKAGKHTLSAGNNQSRVHSATGSPTSQTKSSRPRARSADESTKKLRFSMRESIEDWEIPAEEILTGPRIGAGSFGTVYHGHWHGPVALKKLRVAKPTLAQLQEFKNEISVLRRTRHVNIILFMGVVSKPHLTIVTQWCEGSSLYRHLHVVDTQFDLIQLIEIARQTAQGMDYLHAKDIIHRDLKSNSKFLPLFSAKLYFHLLRFL